MLRDFETLLVSSRRVSSSASSRHLWRLWLRILAFGLGIFGISFLLIDFGVGAFFSSPVLFGRICRRSQEHRSNQYTQKTFHRDPPLWIVRFWIKNEHLAVPPSARHDASFVPDALDAWCVALIHATAGLYMNCFFSRPISKGCTTYVIDK